MSDTTTTPPTDKVLLDAIEQRYFRYMAVWDADPPDTAWCLHLESARRSADDVSELLHQAREALAELATVKAERDRLREHILDIDAHATPFGDLPQDPGYVGVYLLSAGALHRALGKIGHTAPSCAAEAREAAVRPVVEAAHNLIEAEQWTEEAPEDEIRGAEEERDQAWDVLVDVVTAAVNALHGTKSAPRVWAMPSEPGPDVIRVRDVYGQGFERADAIDETGSEPGWLGDAFTDEADVPDLFLSWRTLMAHHAPLTEVADALPAAEEQAQVSPSTGDEGATSFEWRGEGCCRAAYESEGNRHDHPVIGAHTGDEGRAHIESYCPRCEGPNVVWSAPSPLWNEVMRGGSINGTEIHDGIVCPRCFAYLAEERGIADTWRLTAERIHVELETVTPSGRIWSEEQWRWVEPHDRFRHLPDDVRHVVEDTAAQWAVRGTYPAAGEPSRFFATEEEFDAALAAVPLPQDFPRCSLDLTGRTDEAEDPTWGVTFAILDDGERHAYGDQSWVAYGGAIRDSHPNGKVQCRRISISYGPWRDWPAAEEVTDGTR